MRILFQAPILSPTWRGYYANQLLSYLLKNNQTVKAIHVPDECELIHKLGAEYESAIDKTILTLNSSLGSQTKTFDMQILICSWEQAWDLVLPNAINIIIGTNHNPSAAYMLANAYKKLNIVELLKGLDIATLPDEFPKDSVVQKLDTGLPYKFIYPFSFTKLTKEMIDEWFEDFDPNNKMIIYYPEPYCNVNSLSLILNQLELSHHNIEIIAEPLSIGELLYLDEFSIKSFVGVNEDKVHKIYNENNYLNLLEMI